MQTSRTHEPAATAEAIAPPRLRRAWYVLCRSDELGSAPVVRRLWGQRIVLWRDPSRTPSALLDRCPHRNIPLSEGRVVDGSLQCPYHGWRFGTDGHCKLIPGLDGSPDRKAYAALSFPVREQQGYVWVWGDPESAPDRDPFVFRLAEDPNYLIVKREVCANGSIHAVSENALDVPHTAFLHGGLFRNDRDRKPIRCVVVRTSDRVECEYIGEARPDGIVGRLLSPSGGLVVHYDRFYLPSIVEVEYRIGEENHILVNAALTPEADFQTRLYAVVAARTRIPGWLVRPLVTPIALRIFGQDAAILTRQTDTLWEMGEQRFVSSEIDLLGPHILKLLARSAAGNPLPDEPVRREATLLV